MLKLSKHLLTLTLYGLRRVSLKFIWISVGIAWHGWLFRDTRFICSFESETSDSPKIIEPVLKDPPPKFF